MLIESFLAFLPHPGEAAGVDAAAVANFAAGNGYSLVQSEYTLAFKSSGRRVAPLGKRQFFLRTFSGAVHSKLADEVSGLGFETDAWDAWARRKLRFYNLIQVEPDSLTVSGDLLGRMRYYRAETKGGLVLASSIHDLFSCFPDLTRPVDPLALMEYLAGSSPRQDRTLHRRVRVSVTGRLIQWTREGPRTRQGALLDVPEVDTGITTKEALGSLRSQLERSISECVADSNRVVVPLTGGFDSRLIACLAKDQNLECEALTLGYGRHLEVRVAKAVARMLAMKHRLVAPRGNLLDLLDLWRETTEGQVGTGTVFMTGLLDRGYPPGTTVLSGYLGDVLAAGALHWWGDHTPSPDLPRMAGIIADRNFRGFKPGFAGMLGLACSRADMVEAVLPGLRRCPEAHQSMLMFNLEAPRSIAYQVNYLGSEYHVGIPYADPELMRTWLSMPRWTLEKKQLLRSMFREFWPKLATLPHAEEAPNCFPRGWEPVRYLAPWLVQHIGDDLQKRLLPPKRRRANRTNIWHTWHGTSREDERREIEAISDGRDWVGEILDWEIPRSGGIPLWVKATESQGKANILLRSLFLLTDYCSWLGRSLPRGGSSLE